MFIREDTATKGPVTPTCRTRFLAAVMHYAAPARSADDGANPQRTTRNRCRRLPGATSASPSHWLIVVLCGTGGGSLMPPLIGVVWWKKVLCAFSRLRVRARRIFRGSELEKLFSQNLL